MKKQLHKIKIEKIGYGGVGLARRSDGKRILIKGGALPGSVVNLRIVKEKKDYIQAHITEVIKTDPKIVDAKPFCPHFFCNLPDKVNSEGRESALGYKEGPSTLDLGLSTIGCGGCKRQVLSYPNQLKLKEDIVLEAFEKLLKKDTANSSLETRHSLPTFLSIIGSPEEKNYRNKIEFSFGKYITKRIEDKGTSKEKEKLDTSHSTHVTLSDRSLGFHKQGEFSKIIDIGNCGLISTKANNIFEHIKNMCIKSGLPVHDQMTHKGFFRHLAIREGSNTGQILINLSVADQQIKEKKDRDRLLKDFAKDKFLQEKVQTFVITSNNGLADVIKNNESETKILRGDGHIYEKLIFSPLDKGGIKGGSEISFRISPFSFFQTNTLGAQQLFSEAFKLIGHTKGTILDLYCGTGSIGISLLKQGMGDKLFGIEINEEAITDARHNAKINGLEDQVTFLAAAAEKAFISNPELKDKLKNLNLVIIDPPRDGLHKNTVKLISDLKKEHNFKLLYISCNPITMKRDIELLIEDGFTLKIIQPVDMFPQTHHIETIGILH